MKTLIFAPHHDDEILGCGGTILRKVFEWYIGPVVFMTKDKNEDYVEVQLISYDSSDENYCREEKNTKRLKIF